MFKTCTTAALLFAVSLIPSTLAFAAQNKNQQKDPPAHFEGVVSSVDKTDPMTPILTITIKEMRPTSREDEVTFVDKNYDFKIEKSTKILGLDGKPEKEGLKSLARGTKVRIETKQKVEKVAVEIKILPSN
jgi:hypothetical protein